MFTSAGKVTPLYKALSTDFYKEIDFYAARDTKVGPEALEVFGIEKVPALLVLKGGDEIEKYSGECCSQGFVLLLSGCECADHFMVDAGPLKYDKIHSFLKQHATTSTGSKEKTGRHSEL